MRQGIGDGRQAAYLAHAGTYCYRKTADLPADPTAFSEARSISTVPITVSIPGRTQPTALSEAFDSVRFRWGSLYKGRTDPMHYEVCNDGSPHPVSFVDIPENAGVEVDPKAGENRVTGSSLVDTGQMSLVSDLTIVDDVTRELLGGYRLGR